MADYYIQLHHVRKRFGTEEVLKPLDFAVERGKTYGICGNNGSGKTVLMKCICGFLPVTEGLITVDGKRIGYDVDFPESLGVIIETPGFLSNLSGRRNLEILADLRGLIGRKEITSVLKRVGLDPELKKPVAKYSLGMRQRLGIAQAIMEEPELLILDEPFNGLDRHGVAEIRKLLLAQKQKGKTILLASHNSEDIRILCDRVFEMDGGVMRRASPL
ncbi:MAG: ATP-binding cassette domain-containing protein [Lachnospiraceae bacterium]|nr:ATP-binding cassette domain-containing protein [Lachnospiraceae bacterium]